jgi:hypothetical protein
MRKQAKKTLSLLFRFISLRSENDGSFALPFRFRFASFRFEAKIMAVFRFFFALFSLRSIFVSFQISLFRIEAKQGKKAIFFASKQKNFSSVSLHFALKRK